MVIDLPQLSGVLEGRFRHGHFAGVCQVVAKLFHICTPQVAVFGQKDYQQLRIISCMVDELNWPLKIVSCPTLRDSDGLALSSRNAYLTPPQRQRALAIPKAIQAVEKEFASGVRQTNRLVTTVQNVLLEGASTGKVALLIDYVAAVDAMTLRAVQNVAAPTLIAIAVRVGETRLIDNIILTP